MDFNKFMELSKYSENTKKQYGYYEKLLPNEMTQNTIDNLCMEHNNNVFRAFLKVYLYSFLKTRKLRIPKIRGRQKKKEGVKFLSPKEVKRMYDNTDDAMLKIVILLGFQSGLRISEITGIRPCDIGPDNDLEKPTVRITGKGNKEASVPIKPQAERLLKSYIKVNEIGADQKIITLSRQRINQKLEALTKSIGFNKHVTTHMFRHSCGMYLRRKGMDMMQIKEFLRHEKLETTGIYTKATKEEVRQKWEEVMP